MKNFLNYLDEQKIQYYPNPKTGFVQIFDKSYHLVQPNNIGKIFDEDFILISEYMDCDYYVYLFGGRYFYTKSLDDVDFNELKYIETAQQEQDPDGIPFLGVHGVYEILNGSRVYGDWCKKAKFLKYEKLGIVEKNTLAGTFKFQQACKANGIKPILGATYTVLRVDEDLKYDIKLFAENKAGWDNMLRINKEVNVVNSGFIDENKLLSLLDGLVTVNDPKSIPFELKSPKTGNYYQLDTVEYENDNRDRTYLLNLQKFINSDMRPVFLTDAYYLDKEDNIAKLILNEVSGKREGGSENQYFKNLDDYFTELSTLYKDEEKLFDLYELALENAKTITDKCSFEMETGKKHLPEYIMNDEEKKIATSNEDLYWHYIEQGIKEKNATETHINNVEKEYEIINYGNLQDYFLINRDEIEFAKENGILHGLGRGSAPSFTTTWLMGITGIDPVEYKLIPERFLTKERAKGKIADIDIDFDFERRGEVKDYLAGKYGHNQCCSVGTHSAFQIKGAITDIGKVMGVEHGTLKLITKIIPNDVKDIKSLFKFASQKEILKVFIQDNPLIFSTLPLILNAMRSHSMHASAFIITPTDHSIFEWMPLREVDGVLVSEYDGYSLEDLGFLKQDILGLTQLTKFQKIFDSIGENMSLNNIPLNDKRVFDYYSRGWSQDTFQFGTSGLTEYNRELKPSNINDLIAAVALYRPGAMESNFHNEYILLKEGEREPEYMWGTEEILKDTYSLPIYQENVMMICQYVAGFDAATSDIIRAAMGKKKIDLINKYGDEFVKGAVKNGCPEDEAENIWSKLKEFAKYGFNLCISGDERFLKVGHNKSGSTFQPTIHEMYTIKNNKEYAISIGKKSLHAKYKRLGYGMAFSLNNEGRLVKNKIIDIYDRGIEPVLKITLVSGETIKVTGNHKFPTPDGDIMAKDLKIESDFLYVNQGHEKSNTNFVFTNKGKGNDKRYHSDESKFKYKMNTQKGKCGFQKMNTPRTLLIEYIEKHKKNYCELCGDKDSPRLEVHHKNNNHGDNRLENLMTLCVSCHKKEHYKIGRVKMGEKGLLTRLEQIKSIVEVGEERVYDVEVAEPNHNFTIKNGIVTSNSHSVSYALTGYISQWLKVNYPIHFWSVAISEVQGDSNSNEKVAHYISEIYATGDIKILPPTVNKSYTDTYTDIENNTIFWPLSSVKQVGEKSTDQIIEERRNSGEYFSFEEFFKRHKYKGSKVTKQIYEHLILSGAFDSLEGVKQPKDRHKIIKSYRNTDKPKIDVEKDLFYQNKGKLEFNWWWTLQQKILSGIAFFDYEEMVKPVAPKEYPYLSVDELHLKSNEGVKCTVGGYIVDFQERITKKKGEYARVTLESNYKFCQVTIWPNDYERIKEEITATGKCLMLVTGVVNFDTYKKQNALFSDDNTDVLILE